MDQEPKITIPLEQTKILSFEEFSDRSSGGVPRYNNFLLFFSDSISYRGKSCCLKFAPEHVVLDKSLCTKIQEMMNKKSSRSELLKPLDKELYEAYKIMRSYGVLDKDLFR